MNKTISIILLLFLVFNLDAKEKWQCINDIIGAKSVIGGESINDFWYSDSLNNIVHYNNAQKITYSTNNLSSFNSIRGIKSFYISNNRLIIIVIEDDWTTHISEIVNGNIIKYKNTYDVPINFVESIDNELFAFGDFGLILKLVGDKWVKVETPISDSFSQVEKMPNANKVFLNVRNDGIWSFDGKHSKHYRFDKINERLSFTLYMNLETIYVEDYYGNIYKLINDKFIKANSLVRTTFSQVVYNNSNELKAISKKGKIDFIPLYYNVQKIAYLADGHTVILTDRKQVFYNKKFKYNYFNNYSSTMGVELLNYSSSKLVNRNMHYSKENSIIISDFNADGYSDILSFMNNAQNKAILYTKTVENIFNNSTNILRHDKIKFNGAIFSAIDVDRDGITEIFAAEDDIKNQIGIYSFYNNTYYKKQTLHIPDYCLANKNISTNFTDFDRDGDVDLLITYGYSVDGKGGALLYKNNGYGVFDNVDTSLNYMLNGWNVNSLIADFNNDDLNDILLSKSWSANKIFYQQEKNSWKEYIYNPNDSNVFYQRKSYSIAVDFDNDGDLDIFCLSGKSGIKVFENNSKGVFTDITHNLGFDTLFNSHNITNISAADYNNDGFIDLFITSSNSSIYNNILINDSSFHFTDKTEQMEIENHRLYNAVSTDADNDGDIDIFAIGEKDNYLWINNLNDSNFLKISLKGIKSNSLGLGAKVWIYSAGHINDKDFLCAFQQLGSKQFGVNRQSDLIMHFGLDKNNRYDIKVKFYGGNTKELLNVKAGQSIHIVEIEDFRQYFYTLDKKIYNLLNNNGFIYYLFTIIVGLIALSLSIYFGNKLFNWDVKLTSMIISLDIILFTILLFALYHTDSTNRYFIPLGFALLGSLGPLGVFAWIDKYNNVEPPEDIEGRLFQSLRSFSHGEWAASNLNSLQLLFENMTQEDFIEDDYLSSFNTRRSTFLEMTYPALKEIASLSSRLSLYNEISIKLTDKVIILYKYLEKDISLTTLENKDEISDAIIKVRNYLSELKKSVFIKHSCSPLKVYNNLSNDIYAALEENNIKLVFKSFLNENDMALMDANSLADIIENCIYNSIKAMSGAKNKEIKIKLIKDDLRYIISITDNGCGVPEKNQNLIFDNGFSTNNSTGFGLAYAKDILAKYGARIFLKHTREWEYTTFMIELQKSNIK